MFFITVNAAIHFISPFLMNKVILTVTKHCQPQAAVINTSWKLKIYLRSMFPMIG